MTHWQAFRKWLISLFNFTVLFVTAFIILVSVSVFSLNVHSVIEINGQPSWVMLIYVLVMLLGFCACVWGHVWLGILRERQPVAWSKRHIEKWYGRQILLIIVGCALTQGVMRVFAWQYKPALDLYNEKHPPKPYDPYDD